MVSLIGRGQIADQINRLPSPADRVKALRDSQYEAMEMEEREKRERMATEAEEADDEDDEAADDDREEEEE